jgi:hypothetical protein
MMIGFHLPVSYFVCVGSLAGIRYSFMNLGYEFLYCVSELLPFTLRANFFCFRADSFRDASDVSGLNAW